MKTDELYAEAELRSKVLKGHEMDMCQPGYYFSYARNLISPENMHLYDEKHRAVTSRAIEHFMKKIYVALKIGATLSLEHPMENAPWYVIIYHIDGTKECINRFRRRKRAEAWIANTYLYVFQPLTDW